MERHAIPTPLLAAPSLGEGRPGTIHLKLESLQVTGSFKIRGAAARMEALSGDERRRGVIACSSGNHGRAVARVARTLDIAATLCVPRWVDPVKRAAMEKDGATVVLAGDGYDEAEAEAFRLQAETGMVFIHPFDDPLVVSGQATVGAEIVEGLPGVETVVVPLSGGGLAGGVAYALKSARPDARVVAVSAERAAVMLASLRSGEPVELPEEETLANALAGGIGLDNRWTFDLVRERVDEHVVVSEKEIAGAMTYAFRELGLVVEGGGAVALAAVLAGTVERMSGPTAIIVSGGNVDLAVLRRVLEISSAS